MEKVLKTVYLNPNSPAYLAGIGAVYKEAKKQLPSIKVQDVTKFLHKQDVYSLHKPIKKTFPRNRVVPAGLDTDWQADLVDLKSMKKYNKGFTFLLTVVDVLSKYGWAIPLKNKKPETVGAAFEFIIQSSGRKPWRLMTDKGKEFTTKPFQEIVQKHEVHHFTSNSPDVKAPNVERLNKTIKTRLWKHFTLKHTFNYLDILPKIMKAINSSISSVTKHAPIDVTPANELKVWHIAFGDGTQPPPVKFRYKVGDFVRISKEKGKLSKGYLPNFQEEVLVVSERLARHPPVYRLVDLSGEEITGIFYDQELSKCKKPI